MTDRIEEMSNEELLQLYEKSRDPEVKKTLTLRYVHLVEVIAFQMKELFSSFYQMEDIINEGIIAIMKGIDRYDPKRDNKFETFISWRIRGMIVDLVRRNDWLPRNFRKQKEEVDECQARLSLELGRPPTEAELADSLHMEIRKLRRIQRMSVMMNVLSLDMVVEDEDDSRRMQLPDPDSKNQPERACLQNETKQVLIEGVRQLREREQTILSLYYVENLKMKQIAAIMHISEPRVSQLHSSAIRRLKQYMETHGV